MHELAPGLWHWKAPHPDWEPTEPWDQNVSSYAIEDAERLLLFDPLAVPSELRERAADARAVRGGLVERAAARRTAVVLTAPWHERDAQPLVERLGIPVYTPVPDPAEYLMETYGITSGQAGDGSPCLVWLLREGICDAHLYAAGDRL